jgi:RES domain-containing protein
LDGLPTCGWRLARRRFADLSGKGAELQGGRWNSPGCAAVYLGAEAALPVVEVLVHLDLPPELIPRDYVLMRVDFTVFSRFAHTSWIEDGPAEPLDVEDSRAFGDGWIHDARTPILRVPSVIIPEAFNLILNPVHTLAERLPGPTHRPFAFDERLLRR